MAAPAQVARSKGSHLVFGLLLLWPARAIAEPVSIGAHVFWNRGSARSLALGGATVSEAQASSASFENPAAMAFQEGWLTGMLGWGEPRDASFSPRGARQLRHGYRLVGASVSLWETLALGAGLEELTFRSESRPDPNRRFEFGDDISALDMTAALRLGKWFSLGGTLVSHDSARQVSIEGGTSLRAASRASGETWRAGLLGRLGKSLSLGLTFRAESRLSLVHSGNAEARLFRESIEPRVWQAGVAWHPWGDSQRLAATGAFLALQCDAISFPKKPRDGHLYYAPGVVFGALDTFELETGSTLIPRAAIELPLWRGPFFSLITRAGSYREPPFLKGQRARWHGTAGVLLRVWYLALQASIDEAAEYRNWNYGLGLEFDG